MGKSNGRGLSGYSKPALAAAKDARIIFEPGRDFAKSVYALVEEEGHTLHNTLPHGETHGSEPQDN
jgi:hypothetical protein